MREIQRKRHAQRRGGHRCQGRNIKSPDLQGPELLVSQNTLSATFGVSCLENGEKSIWAAAQSSVKIEQEHLPDPCR